MTSQRIAQMTKHSVVYHYTTAAGLLGILDSRTLWASSFQALNDTSEIRYGVTRIQESLTRFTLDHDLKAHGLLDELVKALEDDVLQRELFVLSASHNADSLGLWRNYSDGGYAIGLATEFLGQVTTSPLDGAPASIPNIRFSGMAQGWQDVLYDTTEQDALVHATFSHLLNGALREPTGSISINAARLSLAMLACRLKHPAFADEAEVRVTFDRLPTVSTQYRSGSAGLVPYISVGASAVNVEPSKRRAFTANPPGLLPIRSLRCGPDDPVGSARRVGIATRALQDFGYPDATVDGSAIPFRD